ncbi:hypothetical protein E2C01_086518 [Portunus trituberculatus]|uniref:Uncharacterized protein n=1 Tax=Portunus trituberculatus TaxID=210409 RepID=A0A5B7JET0_PORTR|nr:hypothetical protein [Portunus trituberculatus]
MASLSLPFPPLAATQPHLASPCISFRQRARKAQRYTATVHATLPQPCRRLSLAAHGMKGEQK